MSDWFCPIPFKLDALAQAAKVLFLRSNSLSFGNGKVVFDILNSFNKRACLPPYDITGIGATNIERFSIISKKKSQLQKNSRSMWVAIQLTSLTKLLLGWKGRMSHSNKKSLCYVVHGVAISKQTIINKNQANM